MRGRVLAVEGGEGAGKSTLAGAIAERLDDGGAPVLVLREPGGTGLGESIRNLLLHPDLPAESAPVPTDMPAATELFLFMASRAQLVREKILPAIAAGRSVLLDRYLLSSVAYQGGAGGIGIEAVIQVGRIAIEGAEPDLTLVLDIDPRESLGRLETRKFDRIERKSLEYHTAVRKAFIEAAGVYPWPVQVLDAARPFQQVLEEAWSAVHALFGD